MQTYSIPIWKQAPFIRIIIPLIIGICIQWYLPFSIVIIIALLTISFAGFYLFYLLPIQLRYKFQFVQSSLLYFLVIALAMLLTWNNDYKNNHYWYGKNYIKGDFLLARIDEPLSEKLHSFKAIVFVKAIVNDKKIIPAKGKLLVFFKKNKSQPNLHYGDLILINKIPEAIKNSGNPGAFDNKRYQNFQQIYDQVFLTDSEYVSLNQHSFNHLNKFIYSLQIFTIEGLRRYIKNDDETLGIAEALLIGYKNDLDKDLVQAYSNTGVVHIIAISGLHLGLIYMVLLWLFDRIPFIKRFKIFKSISIISCLWIFSLLTGASASVLRSAVMFTCIIIGKTIKRQSSIYNSLAASAFILLCYNPYFLWDVGFQLSYLAIIGIISLQKPIHQLLYFETYLLKKIWEMSSITIAAQIITFPICLYYFHQFPNVFLISNLIAVPLSTVILFSEIILICFSWIPFLGIYLGKFIEVSIWLMNYLIICFNKIPFAICKNIYANLFSTYVLYALVICILCWLILENKKFIKYAFVFSILFTSIHAIASIHLTQQKKIIVYNAPRKQAIDLAYKNEYYFCGDSDLNNPISTKNILLQPSRSYFQLSQPVNDLPALTQNQYLWQFYGKRFFILDTNLVFPSLTTKLQVDFLIVSKNPKMKIIDAAQFMDTKLVVFEASNSLWKIEKWKKECDALNLPYYSIPEKGAFVFNIP